MNPTSPRFTIVTPSYNQLDWLKLAASSVADQERDDAIAVQHIISDGGSAEMKAFQKWAADQAACISYRIGPDAGMYDAINQGLQQAEGDLCAWLNCDEQYLPGTLKKVSDYFEKHPEVDVLFGDAILVDQSGHALSYRRAVLPDRAHLRLSHINTLSCATFFRKSVVERPVLFDIRWRAIGDAEWMDRVLAAGFRSAVLPEPLAVFTWLPENLSNSERAGSEIKTWRGGVAGAWFRKPWAVLRHRVCKMRAGAYRRRDLNYAIYTRENAQSRSVFQAHGVGWSWPG